MKEKFLINMYRRTQWLNFCHVQNKITCKFHNVTILVTAQFTGCLQCGKLTSEIISSLLCAIWACQYTFPSFFFKEPPKDPPAGIYRIYNDLQQMTCGAHSGTFKNQCHIFGRIQKLLCRRRNVLSFGDSGHEREALIKSTARHTQGLMGLAFLLGDFMGSGPCWIHCEDWSRRQLDFQI